MNHRHRRIAQSPPALILCAEIAGLALARRLGRAGVSVALLDTRPAASAWSSRYCRIARFLQPADETQFLVAMDAMAAELGNRPALLATSDEFLLFLSRHRQHLEQRFRMLLPSAQLLEALVDKRRMAELLTRHGVPTPRSLHIENPSDLRAAVAELGFPCLVKSAFSKIDGNAEAGKVPVRSFAELEQAYARMARFDPRVMVQEYLEGDCGQVALYNAYFNRHSQPVAVFTGRKLRQFPQAFGTACRSECGPHPEIAAPLTRFFSEVGYCGPVDVGMKWDARTRVFKVLDINPRLGQNYRTYVAADGSDLGWLAYRELRGEELPACTGLSNPTRPRLWIIEDSDWRSLKAEGRLTGLRRIAWLASLLEADEFAWWDWRDPLPFLHRLRRQPALPAPAAVPVPTSPAPATSGETYARISR
jgi:predicted ATP-grasp superfamily ATP-dependent carboligase